MLSNWINGEALVRNRSLTDNMLQVHNVETFQDLEAKYSVTLSVSMLPMPSTS